MNIYRISQNENGGYDTYDSAVVCAKNVEDARLINPNNKELKKEDEYEYSWVKEDKKHKIKVELIGTADRTIERGVIVASFNAG